MRMSLATAVVVALLRTASLDAAQTPTPSLAVAGDVTTPLSVTPEQLKTWPRTKAAIKQDGATVVYEGVLVADTVDGKPLFAYQGSLRIVAPKDARGARSIRMLQRLDVVRPKK